MDEKFTKYKTIQHFENPGECHELTFNCFQAKPFLRSERTCEWLASAINRFRAKHEMLLVRYVFMPSHVHLLIKGDAEDYSIARFLKSVKQSVGRKALNYLRKNDPKGLQHLATGIASERYRFWQDGPGYDRNLRTREAIWSSLDYIHNNPVKAELAEYPEDWKWSSAAYWSQGKPVPIHVDREAFLDWLLGK